MDPSVDGTTIEGEESVLVADDPGGACWEVRVKPSRLAQLLALCMEGQALQVLTPGGEYKAIARRWSVMPAGDQLLVRITLERSASA